MHKHKGQAIQTMILVMVSILILVSAVIPTVRNSIYDSNFNGTLKTVTDNIPLILGIAGILFAVGLFVVPSFGRR